MRKLRVVSNDLYEDTYPASWYAVTPSRSVRRRGLTSVDAFGERLVVWRDEDGVAHVQQRFCPHMGASLACGSVEGTRVVCPFHRWEYDADGVCVRVPYLDETKIPKRARLETFPVVEQCGFIWAFNGATPSHALPLFPEWGAKGFGVRTKTQRFDNHPLLILENGCDAQHFKTVHKVDFEHYEVKNTICEPHRFSFDVHQAIRTPAGAPIVLVTSIAYVGASLIYGRLQRGEDLLATFIAAPTPIAPNVTDFTLVVAIKSLPWFLAPLNPIYHWFMARQIFNGATDDYLPIWKHMDPHHRGVLVAEDALQQRVRRYYRDHLPAGGDLLAPEAEAIEAAE